MGYEEAEKRVVDAMKNGYPRFFIHLSIRKLMEICEQKFGNKDESCMLFPCQQYADYCRSFMADQGQKQQFIGPFSTRLVRFAIAKDETLQNNNAKPHSSVDLYIVLFNADAFPLAKQFWQHTGMGVSSRLADHCLQLLSSDTPTSESPSSSSCSPRMPYKMSNRHYARSAQPINSSNGHRHGLDPVDQVDGERSVYLEERYGRNLPLTSAAAAKRALRRRIAGVLIKDDDATYRHAGDHDVEVGPSSRAVKELSEDDVFLFSTGMTAIWQAHRLARDIRPASKSVCFGFPYTDTLKILEKWGPGCHFLGHGLDSDIDHLEEILQVEPVLALFTEFPSNPLLRSADLPRLRALADRHGFLIVVDDSIGNFANVDVLPYADIVVSSLTKIFSGDANVMGGSLVLNPKGQHYAALKDRLGDTYEDIYFDEDAIYMERNSRDFIHRARVIDINTEAVCDFLHANSAPSGRSNAVIREVYYPKYTTTHHYQECRDSGGFGGLFSLTFTTQSVAQAFFDTLACHKGPSLGTNFTLACPYTILAHYTELDWAERWGVDRNLVRVSIGMEDKEVLLERLQSALAEAEKVV